MSSVHNIEVELCGFSAESYRFSVSEFTDLDGLMGRHIKAAAKGNPCSLLMLNGAHSSVVEQPEVEKVLAKTIRNGDAQILMNRFRDSAVLVNGKFSHLRFDLRREKKPAAAASTHLAKRKAPDAPRLEDDLVRFKGGKKGKNNKQVGYIPCLTTNMSTKALVA